MKTAVMTEPTREHGPRVSVVALGQMTNDDLRALAFHGENDRVRIAAALVLAGRETAVPAHPPTPLLERHCR